MLFTQSKESGIQLENALILSAEDFTKASIPANAARIANWARDMHVNVNFNQLPNSDFNCFIGIMTESRVSKDQLNKSKKFLKATGNALMQFIESLPAKEEEAYCEANMRIAVNNLTAKFTEELEMVIGEPVFVQVTITRKSDIQ